MPVLTVQGQEDPLPMDGANEWVENLPNALLLRIPSARHVPLWSSPIFSILPLSNS